MKRKYGNERVSLDGKTFDSKGEAKRYQELAMLQKSGHIYGLNVQVEFILAPSVTINGRYKRPLKYRADFVYMDSKTKKQVVEDFKGYQTPEFKIKQHLMKSVHNIDILLTRRK